MEQSNLKIKRIILSVVSSLAVAVMLAVVCFGMGAGYYLTRQGAVELYQNSEFNFIISGASTAQQTEFSARNDVEWVMGGYNFSASIKNGDKSAKKNMLFVDSEDDLNKTAFTDKRIVSSTSDAINPIFIDVKTAKELNVKVAEKVAVPLGKDGVKVNFTVAAIYNNDTTTSAGRAIALFTGEQKTAIEKLYAQDIVGLYKDVCFVKAKDVTSFKNSLSDYKPMGEQPRREKFDNDASFDGALAAFNKGEYSSRIFDAAQKYLVADGETINLVKQVNAVTVIGIILAILIMFTSALVYFFAKRQNIFKRIERGTLSYKNASVNEIIFFALDGGLVTVLSAIAMVLVCAIKSCFSLLTIIPLTIILPIFMGLLGSALSLAVRLLVLFSVKKRGKN